MRHRVRITSATGRTGRFMRSSVMGCWGMRSCRERVLLEQLPRDDHLLDFGGAFVQLGDAGVAPVALYLELGQVAVAAVHLDRPVRAPGRRLGGVPLGERGLL